VQELLSAIQAIETHPTSPAASRPP
jgi:hypothetical protein